MTKVKRLVYLPDPTVKFYIFIGSDIYCDYDLEKCGLKITKNNELIVKNKRTFFKDLREKMSSNSYDKPYFTDMINNLILFEVISLED